MWFFMITCYAMTAVSFLMLFLTGLQGHFHFRILSANHPTFAILTMITYLFTETLVIFFFVGIGVSIKEYVAKHKVNPQYHTRSLAIKRRLYPPLLLNMLLVMVLFITGGAVDTHHMPAFVHGLLFYIGVIHFAYAIGIQHGCFKESTYIVLEMSGVSR